MPTASEIAQFVDSEMIGDDRVVTNINSLESAKKRDIAFHEPGHEYKISNSDAGVILCSDFPSEKPESTLIITDTPRIDFIKIVNKFFENNTSGIQVHPTAVVDDDAEIGEGTSVGPHAVITGCVDLGKNCTIGAGAIIGVPGYHNTRNDSGELLSMKHRGDVLIQDNVTIHAGAFVHRAVFDSTIIGEGSVVGNHSGIGHNVRIGHDTWIASYAVIGGSTDIGSRVSIHLSACIGRKRNIGDEVVVGSNATVLDDVESNTTVVGTPASPIE